MVFNSFAFLFFFPTILLLYYLTPSRYRWLTLLLASCYFYMVLVPVYILVLLFIILVDFFMGQRIERSEGRRKRVFFSVSLFINIGILFFFKYFNFFNENVHALAAFLHWNYPLWTLRVILPLGLSFHTFQSLSYIIEVYRGKYKAERHLGIYALYVMFFPQLVAGPIERPGNLLPQLHLAHAFNLTKFVGGLQLMAWGFFKKIVLADRLSIAVDHVYAHLDTTSGPVLVTTAIFFAFQLYADFSGYSDIAIGASRTMGFDLSINFRQPYLSKSVAEFWRRWHISLSSWLRDYFYYPIAYARKNISRVWLYFCLFMTFLVSGLWHGAGWTFVAMGALHGAYLVIGAISKPWRDKVAVWFMLDTKSKFRSTWQLMFTFCLVAISWIFFRAPDMRAALAFLRGCLHNWSLESFRIIVTKPFETIGFGLSDLAVSVTAIIVLMSVEILQTKIPMGNFIQERSLFTRTFVYATTVLVVILFGSFINKQFIYFQF